MPLDCLCYQILFLTVVCNFWNSTPALLHHNCLIAKSKSLFIASLTAPQGAHKRLMLPMVQVTIEWLVSHQWLVINWLSNFGHMLSVVTTHFQKMLAERVRRGRSDKGRWVGVTLQVRAHGSCCGWLYEALVGSRRANPLLLSHKKSLENTPLTL